MLSSYNAVIRQYYEDDWQAFKYVLENADRRFTDIDEKNNSPPMRHRIGRENTHLVPLWQ